MRWRRARFPRPHLRARAALRIRPQPAAVDGSLLRAARQWFLAARHPQAARLRLHHRGDRSRRRGRTADDRRAQRPDPPLHAGLPHGRRQLLRGAERAPRAPWSAAAAGSSRRRPKRPDQVQAAPRPSRPAHVASRTVPMPKASPIAAKPAPAPAPVQQAAAPAPKSAEAQAAAPAPTTGAAPAKPAPSIAPTEDMPTAQGLE